ncbi:MAG: hypothetical protein RL685_1698 [Pseudomonadota bacterium]
MSEPVEPVRILIVDDESALVKALCDVLGEQGYAARGCSTGEQALAALQASQFELLLTDLAMPQLDGLGLLRAALQAHPDLGAVVMTGEGTIASAVEAMKCGAVDYVLKPFRLNVMLPVLARALSARRLRLANRELEHTLRERTASLEGANRELEAANRELRSANKELEAFSYSVSHDLRAPLRAIDGFTQGLLLGEVGPLPPDAVPMLQRVVESAATMNQLIDGMLRFSRYSRRPLALQKVDLAELLKSVLKELSAGGAAPDAIIELGDLPCVEGDRSLLRQVFSNLLGNALKFSSTRTPPRIEVGCRRDGTEDTYFVRDNGVGFDMRYAQRLFGVFQRLHPSCDFPGTGIGLSIVHRIVERHGGRIWAEAEPEHGATFLFTLAASPLRHSATAGGGELRAP